MAATFTVEIDWDHNGMWTDETSRTRRAQIHTGFEHPGDAVGLIGRCTLTLDNSTQRFSPGYLSSPLYGKLLPRRQVRIKAGDGVQTWVIFRGFIDEIKPDAGRWGSGQCVIECVDALALLARQRIGVAHEESKAVDEAVSDVVSAAYTPPTTSYSDNGDTLQHYGRSWIPEQTTCLDALREIAEAVYGRFYIARDGTATYLARDDRQNSSASAAVIIGDIAYWQRVQMTHTANLIAYWRLNESSGTAAADSSGHGHSGTASGVTWGASGIGDGEPAASFDGVNDFINLYSTGLRDAFNGSAGTLIVWAKVRAGSVWSDNAAHVIARFYANDQNAIYLLKTSDNKVTWQYKAGNVLEQIQKSTTSAGWMVLALTWDKTAEQVKAYFNGIQEGSTQISLGMWTGLLDSGVTLLGAGNLGGGVHWDGCMAHVALWNVALTANEIAQLSGV